MMRKVFAVSVLLGLSACGFTPQGEAFRQEVSQRGAQAFDQGLENAEWFICQAASVGSIKRRYGRDQEAADAWQKLCEGEEGVDVIGPADVQ